MYCCGVSPITKIPSIPSTNLIQNAPELAREGGNFFLPSGNQIGRNQPWTYRSERSFVKRGRNSNSVGCIFSRASSTVKNAARSISGNSLVLPERGGHSISKVLLRSMAGSPSPSKAQAVPFFPLLCLTLPKERNGGTGCSPVSS